MGRPSEIHFFFKDTSIYLPERTKLKSFIKKMFKNEGKKVQSVNYIFCTDKELLKINRDFLKHDFYTDTITFDLSEDAEEIVGEIYISPDRVKENSKAFDVYFVQELLRVIFHGALHLCGYDDRTLTAARRMKSREDFYLGRYKSFT